MDANITPRTCNLLQNIYNINDVVYHHNTYPSISNDKYYILFSFKIFVNILCDLLDDGAKIVIPINSLKKANILYEFLKIKYTNKKIKIYSSETDDYIKQNDLSDVNSNWVKYDIIMYTPCITAGISFEVKDHFDYLFGYFTNQSCDIYTLYQMLYRVRNLKQNQIYILFDVLHTCDMTVSDKKDIMEEIIYSYRYLYNDTFNFKIKYEDNQTINTINEEDIFFKLWLDNTYIKNKSHYYILYEFIDLLKINKCEYNIIFKYNSKHNSTVINETQIENDILIDENTKLFNAGDISPETYIALNTSVLLSETEKILKKKHFLKLLFNNFN